MQKNILDKLPADFVPRQQWPEFDLLSAAPPFMHPEIVGNNPRGVRWGLWPFYFEEYVSDIEPDIPLSNAGRPHRRTIIWHRMTRSDVPTGWREISKNRPWMDGIAFIPKDKEYSDNWGSAVRSDQRRWRKDFLNTKYVIENVMYGEFRDAYNKSSASRKIGRLLIDIVGRAANGSKREYAELRCARNLETGEVVAGIASITSKTHNASYYLCGFLRENAGNRLVMTGLMDDWFLRVQEGGTRYIHMGSFWRPGKPENWKGFSNFKAKFVTHYLLYQPKLVRFS